MTPKTYYIVKATTGALGGEGTTERLPDEYSDFKEARKHCNQLNKKNTNKRVVYWTDWYWKTGKEVK